MKNLRVASNMGFDTEALSVYESNELLTVYKNILEVIVTGSDFQYALDSLCRAAEGILPNALASIMLFNDDRSALRVRSAPNIPSSAVAELNGLVPGNHAGSCGTAVFTCKPQFIFDTTTDPRWVAFSSFVSSYNINACWSMPIFNSDNIVIGSFALSSFEKRKPNEFHENLLRTAANLAALILLRESEESKLQQAAHRDQLTGLHNRLMFDIRVEQAIASANRNNSSLSILFIDLDNFKQVNDEKGHDIGDKVLAAVAKRMQKCVRGEDTLARLGGDEFILLVEGLDNDKELYSIAQKLLATFLLPVITEEQEFSLQASIGISRYPENAKTLQSLIQSADKAMYQAKNNESGKIQFYSK